VTAREIASHFNAKEVKRGRLWRALCPAHSDRTPSLDIKEGKSCVLLCCQSHHCDIKDIVHAAGLKLAMLRFDYEPHAKIGREKMLRFKRQRWAEGKLGRMERRQAVLMWLVALEPTEAYGTMLEGVTVGIEKHLDAADPQRVRMRKFHAAVERYGWDEVWRRFLLTDKGKAALAKADG
jgi:hypothetical protein